METKTTKNKHLIGHIVTIAIIGLVAMAIILCISSYIEIEMSYHEMGEEMLSSSCVQLEQTAMDMYDGNLQLKDGALYKGDTNLSDVFQKYINDLKQDTGMEYTVIYDRTRVITTIDGMQGKDISEDVYTDLTSGKDYTDFNTDINGTKYYVAYSPFTQDGKYVGAFFAGYNATNIDAQMRTKIIILLVATIVVVVAFVFIGLILSRKYSKKMSHIADAVNELASGNLRVDVDPEMVNRRDELGIISEGVSNLGMRLMDVISHSKEAADALDTQSTDLATSSGEATQASGQVTEAVEEISEGASNQSDSVDVAKDNMEDMEHNIEDITSNVISMDEYTGEMQQACDHAMEALEELIRQSEDVNASVKDIGNTITSTNDSATTISTFTQDITDIAAQTNLLSLNASIEAARAGEAGKGFAVVADEIRKLADQSSESADKIKTIVERLLSDSASSVSVLEKLNENFGEQTEKLSSTKKNMEIMSGNVKSVKETSSDISSMVEMLNDAKNSMTTIVNDLSAISAENAAATEQTNASMEQLNATFTVISESAGELQRLASELDETISYFKS